MVVPKKEYRALMEREKRECPELFKRYPPAQHDRIASNCLTSKKIYEAPDYGPLVDVRELIAFRLAPWLKPLTKRLFT